MDLNDATSLAWATALLLLLLLGYAAGLRVRRHLLPRYTAEMATVLHAVNGTLVTFTALVLGLLVAAQFPLLGVLHVQASVYGTAMALATAGLYLLAMVCALYPSRLAAGIQPAVALREE